LYRLIFPIGVESAGESAATRPGHSPSLPCPFILVLGAQFAERAYPYAISRERRAFPSVRWRKTFGHGERPRARAARPEKVSGPGASRGSGGGTGLGADKRGGIRATTRAGKVKGGAASGAAAAVPEDEVELALLSEHKRKRAPKCRMKGGREIRTRHPTGGWGSGSELRSHDGRALNPFDGRVQGDRLFARRVEREGREAPRRQERDDGGGAGFPWLGAAPARGGDVGG
jgi:hypothetical protein